MDSLRRQRQNLSRLLRSRSNPETTLNRETFGSSTIEQRSDLESGTNPESPKIPLGIWRNRIDLEHCCIYRVPQSLRRANPDAYTPQLVIIGPLHHYAKSQPPDITNTNLMGYLNMEQRKKVYLEELAQRCEGIIPLLRAKIEEDEEKIRASYSESTSWIKSSEFVDMILLDSVFIVEFLLKRVSHYREMKTTKTGDIIFDEPCLRATIHVDLILLENQLPYFVLNGIFDTYVSNFRGPPELTLRKLILAYFGFEEGRIKDTSEFKHFTDLLRCLRVETLGSEDSKNPSGYFASMFRSARMKTGALRESTKSKCKHFTDLLRCDRVETSTPAVETAVAPPESKKSKLKQLVELFPCVNKDKHGSRKSTKDIAPIKHIYNAEKLYSVGVDFVAIENTLSVDVTFENGCLKLPCLWIYDEWEPMLRNIIALEQCHYPYEAYVCNFILFLDFLIDSGKDVELLTEKGIIHNWIGDHSLVAQMVNKLVEGVNVTDSNLFGTASEVNAYYENPNNRTRAVLGRMYFSNLWTGTATVAAVLLLAMTLIQAVASVYQIIQYYKKK